MTNIGKGAPMASNEKRVAFGYGFRRYGRLFLAGMAALATAGLGGVPASAQKSGGILKLFDRDSPASASIHEEATVSAVAPFMGIYNNLVLFDQHQKQNR